MRYSFLRLGLGLFLWSDPNSTKATKSKASSYVLPGMQAGKPIVGNYNGKHRPQVHFSPPKEFMNDPNGCFRDDQGIWHLYYQYNPMSAIAGNQTWGHATSKDLYTWENQPIAIFPPEPDVFVYSGSAVVDAENTSGFFPDQENGIVAIYTLAEYSDGQAGPQQQAISYSRDGGYTFTPYEKNPVIPSRSTQFQDPKVIRYRDRWIMVVAFSVDFKIGIYSSQNLKNWQFESNFSSQGLLGLQYECPNLVEMPYIDNKGVRHDMYLMAISINPGAPLGGSVTQHFPGSFNGSHFTPVDGAAHITDFGKDNYAGQFFYGLPKTELPVYIGWASNWQYAQVVPTGEQEGWRSVMSLPRQSYLAKIDQVGWKLVSRPHDMTSILGKMLASTTALRNSKLTVDFSKYKSNAVYFQVNATKSKQSRAQSLSFDQKEKALSVPKPPSINYEFAAPKSSEKVSGGFHFGTDTISFIDRGQTKGFDNVFFSDKFSTDSIITADTLTFTGIFDRSILEIFVQGGEDSATTTFSPKEPLTRLILSSSNIPDTYEISVLVKELKSTWSCQASSDGLVHGNVT